MWRRWRRKDVENAKVAHTRNAGSTYLGGGGSAGVARLLLVGLEQKDQRLVHLALLGHLVHLTERSREEEG